MTLWAGDGWLMGHGDVFDRREEAIATRDALREASGGDWEIEVLPCRGRR